MKQRVGSLKRLVKSHGQINQRKTQIIQINTRRDERGNITTNTNEIQKIKIFKNLYSTKLEILKELDELLDAYNLSKVYQDKII